MQCHVVELCAAEQKLPVLPFSCSWGMAGAALRGTARISALKRRDLMVAAAQEVLWIHSVVTTGIPQKRNKPLDFLKPKP